ncbi:MAG TPA: acyl-CoA dehydrogenase family protein [Chloroflexota bacterium]|nr:acyl-CoA dehydrogenase family protein [Chloroflexota bacterium]
MNFALADEEKALAEALAQNLSRVCSTQRIRAWEADQVSFDDAFVSAVAQGGFLEAGLAGGDCPAFAVLAQLEEVAGRFLAPPLLTWLSGYAAFLLGDHPLAKRLTAGEVVAPLIPGRTRLSLAGGRLTGEAEGVPFLDRAQQLLVPLPRRRERLGEDAPPSVVALVRVERRVPSPQPSPTAVGEGVVATLVTTQSLVPHWRVTFAGAEAELVPVSAERQARALDRLRTCVAAWSTGAGSRAIELASAYACEREQFGHPIGSYQSVQNRLVDAAIQVEQARMLVYRAASLIDGGESAAADVAVLARHHAGKAFAQASRAALQTFGGYGFTVDFDAQLYFRRAKEAQLSFEPRPAWQIPPSFRS